MWYVLFAATFSLERNASFVAALDKVAAMCGVPPPAGAAANSADKGEGGSTVPNFTMSVLKASIHGWKQALSFAGRQVQGSAAAAAGAGGDGTSQASKTEAWSTFANAVSALEADIVSKHALNCTLISLCHTHQLSRC